MHANARAVNSRLLDRQMRRHENQTCCDEHVVQSVLMDSGRSQMKATGNVGDRDAVISEMRRCLIAETTVAASLY